MKLLTTLIIACFTSLAFAEMPEYMKDGKITVTLKDGKTYEFSTNEYMVVKRGVKAKKEVKQDDVLLVEKKMDQESVKKNSVILHAGVGQSGLTVRSNGNLHEVEEDQDMVGGLTYCRSGSDNLGVCGTAITNKTFMLGIKKDF